MKCQETRRTLDYPTSGTKLVFMNSILLSMGIIVISCILSIPVYAQTNDTDANNNSSNSNLVGWKTYTSDSIGISFDYPSDWQVQEKENRFDTGADVSVSNGDLKFWVVKLDRPADDPLTGLPAFTRTLEQGLAQDKTNTIIEHTDVKKNKIGGESAGTLLVKTDDGISSYGIQLFAVIHAGDGYMLNFRDSTKTFDTPETEAIMNKILQSFKFLN